MMDGGGFAATDISGDVGDALVFVIVEQHTLTSPSSNPEPVDPRRDVELQHPSKGLFIQAAIRVHGRNYGGNNTLELNRPL